MTTPNCNAAARCIAGISSNTGEFQKTEFSRFPVPDMERLPEDLRARVMDIAAKTGFMPNVFSGLAYRPDELRAFFSYYDIVMQERGNLTLVDKELIIVATSGMNRCLYCIVAHSALHRIYSKNPLLADQLSANWKSADIDDRQRAILEFAMDLKDCIQLSEARFDDLKKHGLTLDDAWDIGSVVSFFALSNRMAYMMNLKPNPEFHLMGRAKREEK